MHAADHRPRREGVTVVDLRTVDPAADAHLIAALSAAVAVDDR